MQGLESLVPYLTGGAGTVGLVVLGLFLTGKQPGIGERRLLLAEVEKRDVIIRDLTTELREQSDAIRHDVVPVLTQLTQLIPHLVQRGQ